MAACSAEVVFHVFRQWHVLRVAQTRVRLRLSFPLALRLLHDLARSVAFWALDSDRLVAEVSIVEMRLIGTSEPLASLFVTS